MSYRKAIEAIQGWENLTEAEVVDLATRPEHVYADPDRWTLLGFATIIGKENVKPLIDLLESIGYGWIATQAAAGGVPIGAPDFNAAMREIPHPFCQMIADRGRRMVSLCELFRVDPVADSVAQAYQAMKLERLRLDKRRGASTRYNVYVAAIDAWNGDPETEPNL